VIGQLPVRYRVVLLIVGSVACVGAGAWLAFTTPLPVVWQYGAVAGALVAPALVTAYSRGLAARDTGRTSPASRG
jgi:hypothetical protein